MKNWKYVVAGLSCAALVALAPMPQVNAVTPTSTPETTQAPAESETGTSKVIELGDHNANVNVDFAKQTMTIITNNTKNTKLYVSFPTVKDGKVNKDGTWVAYDVSKTGAVTVDLSSAKIASDFYVQVKGNGQTEPTIFHFAATDVKYKGIVDNAAATVKLQYSAGENKGKDTTAALEYRTPNGSWSNYTNTESTHTDLTIYQEKGATVNFRTKAVDKSTTYTDTGNSVKTDNTKETVKAEKAITTKDGVEIPTYEVEGSFASNEVKVKIGKRPNGPKISVDYKKHTFTIAKGMYSVYSGIKKVDASETATTSKATIDGDTAYVTDEKDKDEKPIMSQYIANDGAIEAWYAAIEGTKSKAESAHSTLFFKAKPILAFQDLDEKEDDDGFVDVSVYVNENIIVNDEGKDAVTAILAEQSEKERTEKVHTLTIKNSSDIAYEVIISDKNETPTPDAKCTSIAKAKEKKFTKVKDGAYVFIRSAADSKAGVWSSDFTLMGQVPETIDATTKDVAVNKSANTITVTFDGTISSALKTELEKADSYNPTTVSLKGGTAPSVSGNTLTITLDEVKAGSIVLKDNALKYMLSDSKKTITIKEKDGAGGEFEASLS